MYRHRLPQVPTRADEVAVTKRLAAAVHFWTLATDYARTAGVLGSLVDLRADHPFICRHAGQLQTNSRTPESRVPY
eukprot:357907-Chlamydomonas_euryale.AAC.9